MPILRLLLLVLLFLAPAFADAAPRFDPLPRVAVFSAYAPEWKALTAVVEKPVAHQENGVQFVTGRIAGHNVVLVLSGVSMVNAALTAQMTIDRYNLQALLFSGIAGGVDPSLEIGDVVVADRWGQYLEAIFARKTPQGYRLPQWAEQKFPNYGMIFPRGVAVAHQGQEKPVRQFWFPVDQRLFAIAQKSVPGVELRRCLDAKDCLTKAPKVVVGGNGVSGAAFVDNAEFRQYAFDTFKAKVLDMESASVAQVATMNGVPYLAFRSLSDLAGGGAGENEMKTFEHLAAENSVRVLRAFLKALPQ